MACGRLAKNDSPLSRDMIVPQAQQVQTPSADSTNRDFTLTKFREVGAHEAVLFLQKEHESVLHGVHDQMKMLQRKCDDLQFELHLRHINSNVEDSLRKSLETAQQELKDYSIKMSPLKAKLDEFEDYRQHQKWQEIQLQQRVDSVERKNSDLNATISRLNAQIRDLKICNSALRSRVVGHSVPPVFEQTRSISPQFSQRNCESSLDSMSSAGDRSSVSLRDSYNDERQLRYGKSLSRLSRIHSSPPLSLAHQYAEPDTSNARPISGGVVLPPINKPTQTKRPHVRKQLRLLSAPIANAKKTSEAKSAQHHPP